jgi:hypothetical protein
MTLAALIVAGGLATALERAAGVAACAKESSESAQSFVRRSFDVRKLTLYDGTRVAIAVSHSPCLAHNSVNRVLAYADTGPGWRNVLDDYGFDYNVAASGDGTVTLDSHETVDVVDEATYVWNGARYLLSRERSHRYDVALDSRRPYVARVRFARGASSAVLSGRVARGFGDDYEFDASAGQRVTIRILKGSSKLLRFNLYQDRPSAVSPTELTLSASPPWNAALPESGTWKLDVYGAPAMDDRTASPYALVLTITATR